MVKTGFSLVEALVVMAIISLLFTATAKVLTVKPKPKVQTTAHGYFECYKNGSTTYQRYVRENVETDPEMVTLCEFKPPTGVLFYNINTTIEPVYSSFEPNINQTLKIQIQSQDVIINAGENSMKLTKPTDDTPEQNEDIQADIQTFSTREQVKDYLASFYPNSKIYNNGNVLSGVIISW